MMREIDVRVHPGHAKAPQHDAKRYVPTIAHGYIIERRRHVFRVFVACLMNERGQRICVARRRLRAELAKEEYATTWQEED